MLKIATFSPIQKKSHIGIIPSFLTVTKCEVEATFTQQYRNFHFA
jgi:hypothetical protein